MTIRFYIVVLFAISFCGSELRNQTELSKGCDATNGVLKDAQKMEILRTHNSLRKMVADGQENRGNPGPQPAGKIPPLEWDDELAIIAQKWAMQCPLDGECDEYRDTARFRTKNTVWAGIPKEQPISMSNVITHWYEEVISFNGTEVKSYAGSRETESYTQLVWGKSTHIGCGHSFYTQNTEGIAVLVCNYGPAGNIKGAPVYDNSSCSSPAPEKMKKEHSVEGFSVTSPAASFPALTSTEEFQRTNSSLLLHPTKSDPTNRK